MPEPTDVLCAPSQPGLARASTRRRLRTTLRGAHQFVASEARGSCDSRPDR
ncbi:hypothetical protein [Streptomyces atroolivaceus]|uniref:hypothetical protein n=1 Tax=Streptomyces atroolivaceus TaxID=66869 RepID=UPI0020242E16|nr:hypothetical protein [Streptomyces atroolivaceus]